MNKHTVPLHRFDVNGSGLSVHANHKNERAGRELEEERRMEWNSTRLGMSKKTRIGVRAHGGLASPR